MKIYQHLSDKSNNSPKFDLCITELLPIGTSYHRVYIYGVKHARAVVVISIRLCIYATALFVHVN